MHELFEISVGQPSLIFFHVQIYDYKHTHTHTHTHKIVRYYNMINDNFFN